MAGPFVIANRGVRVQLRVTPKAAENRITGVAQGGAGVTALKVKVTAAPDRGKANEAVLKLLAREWGLAKSTLKLVAGETSRSKVVLIEGDASDLMPHLESWLEGLS